MTRGGEPWFDEAAGPVVRPYALIRGRTMGAAHDLDMLTVVVTTTAAPTLRRPEPEYGIITALCAQPKSVAEVAAHLQLPVAVTKILVGDLIGEGHLIFRAPVQPETGPGGLNVLRAVLDGIRKL
ncbi:DUF742 domain-containing protein [Nocardia farcinica]|uniref:DUF742 domain-containing protein n=2 Tax=Nocardia farcinica TaxID=37329 RepID=Q5YWB5_NOCFA|nr:DUF742 domain-containing protein [Nocardia farcinica]AXK84848.1 DUF742 domain-containing protein [Nocardia farcinica]MBA4854539.1 DUF742 domain-containing protein [Nocardia farcinica]MBC9814724.1 DUF742 domain-containing protein [Nocardia farcinica]MBF6067482.1 DUF742 domain-containing protein [Nocardia farcinica]MBF6139809.1 DUF742 domain-containing protein [Nocardia farcinica]